MRALVWCSIVALGCTGEAVIVQPDASAGGTSGLDGGTEGSAGAGDAGAAGAGSGGEGGGRTDCAPIEARLTTCITCAENFCQTQLDACENTDCACGQWGGFTGQATCLLECETLRPDLITQNTCAAACGVSDVTSLALETRDLLACLAPPMRPPPTCAECFVLGMPPTP